MDKLLVQKNEAKDAELKADEKALEEEKNKLVEENRLSCYFSASRERQTDKWKLEAIAKNVDEIIKFYPNLKSDEAKKIFNDSMGLLIKVSSYMREKTSKL
jgi:hypothetical protein